MRISVRRLAMGLVVVAVGALLVWGFVEKRAEVSREKERERPLKAPTRVRFEGGETVVQLDEEGQRRSGVEAEQLPASRRHDEIRTSALVLPVAGLIDLARAQVDARTRFTRARASLDSETRELQRLELLHADDGNASTRAVEEARSRVLSARAEAEGSERSMRLVEEAARQQWGEELSKLVLSDASGFHRIVDRKDVLVQATLPPGETRPAPAEVRLQGPDGRLVTARLLSAFARLDPRLQARSFLYVAPAGPQLLPGATLVAFVPMGAEVEGVLVPAAAVVWWQGRAWIYVVTARGRFTRREVATARPSEEGWFVTEGLSPGDRLVVSGAQTLLSEEFRSQVQVGVEGGS